MKTIRLSLAGLIAASAAMVATAGPAQAYPDLVITLEVTPDRLVGGGTISVVATNSAGIEGDWTLDYSDGAASAAVRTGTGVSITEEYVTKKVTSETDTEVVATFEYDDEDLQGGASIASALLPAEIQTAEASATVTLLPTAVGGEDDGLLPNTGGAPLGLGIAALVLLAGGGYLVARRNN